MYFFENLRHTNPNIPTNLYWVLEERSQHSTPKLPSSTELKSSFPSTPKKVMLFCLKFPDFRFVYLYFTHILQLYCMHCLLHMENHIDWVGNVKSVEEFLRINQKSENICQKSNFWFSVVDYEIFFSQKKQTQNQPGFLQISKFVW